MRERFEARYRISLDDWRACSRQAQRRRPATRFLPYVVACLAGLSVAFGLWLLLPGNDRVIGSFFLAYGVLALPLFYGGREWRARRSYKQQRLGESDLAIAANDDRLAYSNAVGSGEVRWQAFQDVDDVGDRVLIWLNEVQAVIVPKSAFQDRPQAERFATFVRDRIRAAKA